MRTCRLSVLFVCVLTLLVIRSTPGQARSDIAKQLYENSAITKPPTPLSLNSALTDIVGTVENLTNFDYNLQRALLWSAGWVQAIPEYTDSISSSNDATPYVQVYVHCGQEMSDIFLSSQIFESTACELTVKECKSNVISFTESTCDPSYVETRTACAINPERGSWKFSLEQKNGPIWSIDGQIDGTFDPQLFQYNDSGSNTTIYMLAQKGSWSMDDDTCPNGAQFIVPCRQIPADDNTWCEPEIEENVRSWAETGVFPTRDDATDTIDATASSSGSSKATIVGIVLAIAAVAFVAVVVVLRRRRSQASQDRGLKGQTGLWEDDIITANRIPREKVRVLKLISRGAFGEVYAGIYNNDQVAIKMLLPSTRRDIHLVNEFLAEAKLTASMEHPRIVTCIGIAWDSLSDLCVVLEFMEGGDLRTLLESYKRSSHPVGFDCEKTTIALHVCHALTYLHSLEPPIIHRDLESRNILLDEMHEAKLTDFGISRERLDRTMTAGVGTSLWMAPEVMTGEKYDDKADIFSFGVVLSELDTHSLPYAQARQEMQLSHGRQMTDATLLQKVAMGTVTVEFSDVGPKSMTDLGCACISIDPTMRPSAAEALFKLQVILSKELV
ncbi:TKL protein kinase [Phytophthora nicotianae CJ01A1]|uniref:TKL protein kinase n=3 Tax=Phytophthora nicotianae TaxID=4792 RepID=W2X4A5_PHYNI|nr:TKL protein kinase [Phytophthora nicotianae CJ01A1]